MEDTHRRVGNELRLVGYVQCSRDQWNQSSRGGSESQSLLRKVIREDALMPAEKCTVWWARCTSAEATAIVKSVTGLDGVETWAKTDVHCSRSSGRKSSSEFGDRAGGGKLEGHDE